MRAVVRRLLVNYALRTHHHKDRDQFAELVRDGLKEQTILDENEAYIPRLR